MLVDQVGAEQDVAPASRGVTREIAQSRQRIRLDQAVGIDERQPRRVAFGGTLVAGDGEAGVVGIADEAHARVGRRMALDDGEGAVLRGIVDDADLRDAVGGAQAREAVVDGRAAFVADDDGGDVGGGRHAMRPCAG